MSLFIYLLRAQIDHATPDGYEYPIAPWTYECANGFVVIASAEDEARQLIMESKYAGYKLTGGEVYVEPVWTMPEYTTCEMIGVAKVGETPRVVLRDFSAG